MKKVIGLLTLALMASTANAVEVEFSGSFNFGEGSISATDSFSGKFDFDLLNPDGQSINGMSPNQEINLDYHDFAEAYVDINEQRYSSDHIELNFTSNDFNITNDQIAEHGFSGLVTAGIYDFLALSGRSSGVTYDPVTDALFDGVEFSIIALFEKNTFEAVGFDFQQAMAATPVFLGFEVQQIIGGVDGFHGAGQLATMEISAVPVPAAVWLFGSAMLGLAGLKRKKG